MISLKGTQTEKNLLASFAGESQARNHYSYFASVAKKEGYEQIAAFFLETAENEKEHAKRFLKCLEGGPLEITASYSTGPIGDTKQNLAAAAAGEHHENTVLYPMFAETAEKEGFPAIALVWKLISNAEKSHESRYAKLLYNLENNSLFKKEQSIRWKCRNCGYIHEGKEAPELCPACQHPRAYFELKEDNY